MIKHNLTRLSLLTTFFLSISAAGTTFASTADTLKQEASHFLTEHFSKIFPNAKPIISIQTPSSRLNLQPCREPAKFKTNNQRGGRVSVRVACDNPRWQFYLSGNVTLLQQVVAAATTLTKGPTLLYPQLQLIETDISRLNGNYFTAIDQVIGMSLRHTVKAGQIIKASSVLAATLISRDDAVTIEASNTHLSIRTAGTALESGKKGEQIRVRNDKSGIIIKAVIIAPGLVRTP